MPASDITAARTTVLAGSLPEANPRYLFGPVFDFVGLGGSFLLLLPIFFLLPLSVSDGTVATIMLVIANFVNHPHFAHSYQVFYRHFGDKICGPT